MESGNISSSIIKTKVSLSRFSTTKNFPSKISPILLHNMNTQGMSKNQKPVIVFLL